MRAAAPDTSFISATVLDRPGTVLLDAARRDASHRESLLFTAPRHVLVAATLQEVLPILHQAEWFVNQGFFVAGYLSYEAGYAFEDIGPLPLVEHPLIWLGVYDAPTRLEGEEAETLFDTAAPATIRNPRFSLEKEVYVQKIEAIRSAIHEGEVYQVNFTDKVRFELEGTASALFGTLRRRQRVPYGAFLNVGSMTVLCLSPELFFARDGDQITTRPMKGTVRRGRSPEEDAALHQWLATDPKSQAENLMIVDLLRNDLSRCCVPGSVQVPHLFETTAYETLIQMTSTIEGKLRPGIGYAELFKALFPCGSVTGAPRISAMKQIRTLESGPRGVYCGSIGYIGPDQQAVFNVAIRTVVIQSDKGMMGTGGGIVWDSVPADEYDECCLKAAFLAKV